MLPSTPPPHTASCNIPSLLPPTPPSPPRSSSVPPYLAPSIVTCSPSRPPLVIAASTSAFSELAEPSSPVDSSPRRHSFVVTLNLEPHLSPALTHHRRNASVVSAPEGLCSPPSPFPSHHSPSSTFPPYSPPPSPIPSPSPPPTTTTSTLPPPSVSPSPSPPPAPLPASTPSRKPRLGFKLMRSGSMKLPKKPNIQSPSVLLRRSAPSGPNTPSSSPHTPSSSPPPLEESATHDRRSSLPQGTEPLSLAAKIAERKSELMLQYSRFNNAVKWGAKVGINSTLRRTWSSVRAGRIEEDHSFE